MADTAGHTMTLRLQRGWSPHMGVARGFSEAGWVRRWLEVAAFVGSHVRHPGEGGGFAIRTYGVASAIFVSVLWGLWHHPIVPQYPIWLLLPAQVAMGPILSLFWRRTGNLMVPGFAHALNDAIRNVLSGGVP